MEKIILKAEKRKEIGSSAVKKIRSEGLVPAVLYKKGEPATEIKFLQTDLIHILHTGLGENVVITLKISDDDKKQGRPVIIKEIQHDIIKEHIIHADFQEISLKEKVKVSVPVVTKGEAIGVTTEGGVLEHILWNLEVECLPTDIPKEIKVDVSNLNIGDVIHVKEIETPAGVSILNDPDDAVIAVEAHKEEKEEKPAEGEEEITEPEVITEKKSTESGEETSVKE